MRNEAITGVLVAMLNAFDTILPSYVRIPVTAASSFVLVFFLSTWCDSQRPRNVTMHFNCVEKVRC